MAVMIDEPVYPYKQLAKADLKTLIEVNATNPRGSRIGVVKAADGTLLVPKDVLSNPIDKRGRFSYSHAQYAFVFALSDYKVLKEDIVWPEVTI